MIKSDYAATAGNLQTDLIRINDLRYRLQRAVEDYASLRARALAAEGAGDAERAAGLRAEAAALREYGHRVWVALRAATQQ